MLLDVLVGLLDKQSNDLRALANVVFGLVSSAVTVTGIEHLIAQLEAAPGTSNEEEADEEAADEEDDDDEDDEDEEADDSDSASEIEIEEDDDAEVDPEFRRKIAEALQVSGMGIDGDDDTEDGSDDDSDEEDEDNWDDDQMLKVDEQLAEIFKQQAAATSGSKKSEQKR
jgi:DNA polymerase phi